MENIIIAETPQAGLQSEPSKPQAILLPANQNGGSLNLPCPFLFFLFFFLFLFLLGDFTLSVKKATACLRKMFKRIYKKGRLYFSIVSCQMKSSHWLVIMFNRAMH